VTYKTTWPAQHRTGKNTAIFPVTASWCLLFKNSHQRAFVPLLNGIYPPVLVVQVKYMQRQFMGILQYFYPNCAGSTVDQAGQYRQASWILQAQWDFNKLGIEVIGFAEQNNPTYVKAGADNFQKSP